MNFLVQCGKLRGPIVDVPEGLHLLVADITREVLRCQPDNDCLLQFIHDYVLSVHETNEKAKLVKKMLDRSMRGVNELMTKLCFCDSLDKNIDEMAEQMEYCFRKFLEKRNVEKGRAPDTIVDYDEKDDVFEEIIGNCKIPPEEMTSMRAKVERAYELFADNYLEKGDPCDHLYVYLMQKEDVRNYNKRMKEAAIRIQASMRGYLVRKSLFEDGSDYTDSDDGKNLMDELDHAARILQRFFKSKYPSIGASAPQEEETAAQGESGGETPKSVASLTPFKRQVKTHSRSTRVTVTSTHEDSVVEKLPGRVQVPEMDGDYELDESPSKSSKLSVHSTSGEPLKHDNSQDEDSAVKEAKARIDAEISAALEE